MINLGVSDQSQRLLFENVARGQDSRLGQFLGASQQRFGTTSVIPLNQRAGKNFKEITNPLLQKLFNRNTLPVDLPQPQGRIRSQSSILREIK